MSASRCKMSANQKSFTVRVGAEVYQNASDKAKDLNISLTELVRASVVQFCTQRESRDEPNPQLVQQLENKDQQIDQLHQLLGMQAKTNALLSEEISNSRKLIDDLTRPKPSKSVWGKISAIFASS